MKFYAKLKYVDIVDATIEVDTIEEAEELFLCGDGIENERSAEDTEIIEVGEVPEEK